MSKYNTIKREFEKNLEQIGYDAALDELIKSLGKEESNSFLERYNEEDLEL